MFSYDPSSFRTEFMESAISTPYGVAYGAVC